MAIHDDVLSLLIEAQKVDTSGILTDHQVLVEVMNLFAAGYEVVAHTLAFTLYLVAKHPAVEARIAAELESVLGGDAVTLETAGRLTYLDQVIKESMRLLPVTFRARSAATFEAVIGVLYTAVIVARLVGLYAAREVEEHVDADSVSQRHDP